MVKTLDILNQKMYNINRSGENIASVEEYNIGWNGSSAVDPVLVGTMFYSFDSNGKQFRKKYVAATGEEQKYVFEFKDEQNVAVQLPTGAVSHAKSDHFGRKVFDELQLGKGFLNRTFTYHEGVVSEKHEAENKRVSEPTTTLVKEIKFADGRTIQYEYDEEERITKVVDSVDGTRRYEYDSLGQLTKEERLTESYFDTELNEEIDEYTTVNTMSYDLYGNITEKNGIAYGYDGTWKDKLTSYNGQSISYDANGNPIKYRGNSLTWEKGRQLKQFGAFAYKYNNDGIRIEKVENCKTHKYILDGTNILKEVVTDNCCNCNGYTNEYLYDLDGTVCGIKYNGTAYYFYKNLQGDVIAITDETGAVKARYSYDAWGKCKVESDTSGVNIATVSPFRYRSYYYDSEIGMYYLQSRYYDPEVGRFINADAFSAIRYIYQSLLTNVFSYCVNNPVDNLDPNGFLAFPGEIHRHVQRVMALYILFALGSFTYIDYFIRFSKFKYGFADLYARSLNEIWEVKPDKQKYYKSGPKQLQKYLDSVNGSKAGRNLGEFVTYYFSSLSGFNEVIIKSITNDGMIYYDYRTSWKVNSLVLLSVVSAVLICTGVGAPAGVAVGSTLVFA